MVADFHLLRDPRVIKIAAISTAVIAVSVGVGLTVAGTRKAPASSLQVNGGIEAVSKNGAANNGAQEMSSYLANSDHLDTIDEIVDTSDGTRNGETVNGYSLYGVYRDSDGGDAAATKTRTRKCGDAAESSGEESSSKSGKESSGRRRLGWASGWGNPIVSSGTSKKTTVASSASSAKSEKTTVTSSATSAKSEKTTDSSLAFAKSAKTAGGSSTSSAKSGKAGVSGSSTSSAKSEKTEISEEGSSWGAGWSASSEDEPSPWDGSVAWDVDCDTATEVVVTSKGSGVSSKSSKTKSSKVKQESAKSSPATVSSAWERSPPAPDSNVWGSSPTSSPTLSIAPTPSVTQLESLAPVQSSLSVSFHDECVLNIFAREMFSFLVLASFRLAQPTSSPNVETTTNAPTPCTGRTWYFNEEKDKCTNDGENDGQVEYEKMRTCCETEVGMNVECPYEDVCIESSPTKVPTHKPTTLQPVVPEVITESPTTAPITSAPTSATPTSDAPTTPEIITGSPTTSAPITSEPTSAAPTSDAPTVPEIITESPVTSEPTYVAPTSATPTIPEIITEAPSTSAPVTAEPSSAAPTVPEIITSAPTTSAPDTAEPTSAMPTVPEIVTTQPSPAPTPCEGRRWYALSTQRVFQCTNGYDIPVEAVDFTFFNTMEECCEEIFGEGEECDIKDVCVETVETGSPSPAPSFGSTPTVSKETTGPPTFSVDRTGGAQ